MRFGDVLDLAKRRVLEWQEDYILCVGLEVEMEFMRRGIEVGVTEIILGTEPAPLRGFIVDINYHPYYGFHAIFISSDNDQSKNRFITADAKYTISLRS